MGWGLLAGAGRGLSQGAEMLYRGMAEDRQVARENERYQEERRWREAMENRRLEERRADKELAAKQRKEDLDRAERIRSEDVNYRKGRDEVNDKRYNTERRVGQINAEVGKIFNDYQAEVNAIHSAAKAEQDLLSEQIKLLVRAQKSNDPASILAGTAMESVPVNQIGDILNDMNSRLSQIDAAKRESLQLVKQDRDTLLAAAKSYYGDDIAQSNFASMLNSFGLTKQETKDIDRLSYDNNVIGIGQSLFGEQKKAENKEPAQEPDQPIGEPTDEPDPFGLWSGIKSGFNASTADTGSYFGNLKRENSKYSADNTSPLGHVLHPVGGLLGSVGGFVAAGAQDVAGAVGDGAVSAYRAAFETPAERRARIGSTEPSQALPPSEIVSDSGVGSSFRLTDFNWKRDMSWEAQAERMRQHANRYNQGR